MESVSWKCKYCGSKAKVAQIMVGRRVRCPACSCFSLVRKIRRVKKLSTGLQGPHFLDPEAQSTRPPEKPLSSSNAGNSESTDQQVDSGT